MQLEIYCQLYYFIYSQFHLFAWVTSMIYFCYILWQFSWLWCAQNFACNFVADSLFSISNQKLWILEQHTIRKILPIVLFDWFTTSFFYMCCQHDIFFVTFMIFLRCWCAQTFACNFCLLPFCFQYFNKRIWILKQHAFGNLLLIGLFHWYSTSYFACVTSIT